MRLLVLAVLLATLATSFAANADEPDTRAEMAFAAGMAQIDSPDEATKEKAQASLGEACDQGHALACLELGMSHNASAFFGSKAAEQAIFTAFQKGCALQQAEACRRLGLIHDPANVLHQMEHRDWPKAMAAYEQGCELGDGLACWNGVRGAEYGSNPARDGTVALSFARRACSIERRPVCANLPRAARE
jgi:TPR repeat protein